MNIKEEGINYG